MPPLDASIILQGQQPNLLGTLQNVQNYKNSQIENQLLQLRQKSEQGTLTGRANYGRAIQQNTGPDGDVNWHNSLVSMSQDPANALYMSDAANQNLAQQSATQGVRSATAGASQAELANAAAHLQTGIQLFSGLEGKKGIATASDVDDTLATGIRSGMFNTPESFSQMMAERDKVHDMIGALPKGPDGQPDPQAVDKIVRTEAGNYRQHMQDIAQHPLLVNTGRQQLPYTASATGGLQPQAGAPPIVNELSPEAQVSRVPTVNPDTGEAGTVPQSALSTPTGQPRGGNGFLPTNMAPGSAETLQANAGRVQQIQSEGLAAARRIAAAQAVRSEIGSVPATAFGPTSKITSTVGKLAAAFGVSPPAAVNGQASLDALHKSLAMITAAQAQTYGAGTDASRAMVKEATPSTDNSREGLLRNLAQVQGNDQWAIARNRAWQSAVSSGHLRPSDEPKFEAAFNKEMSPLVFQAHYMDQEGQQQIWKTLSGSKQKDGSYTGEKGDFLRGMQRAEKFGWFGGQ